MANELIDIQTSQDFFCDKDRESNYTIDIIKYKNLKYISRPGSHEMNLDQLVPPTPLASSSKGLVKKNASQIKKVSMSSAERREMMENIIRGNMERLLAYPKEVFHLKLTLAKQQRTERLKINLDIIFNPGDKYQFKLSADCVCKTRKRELLCNAPNQDYAGYSEALALINNTENLQCYVGKLKNRSIKNFPIPRRIIRDSCVAVYIIEGKLYCNLYIGEARYTIELTEEYSPQALKYYTHRGSYQNTREEAW
jgi:hypothetical protein